MVQNYSTCVFGVQEGDEAAEAVDYFFRNTRAAQRFRVAALQMSMHRPGQGGHWQGPPGGRGGRGQQQPQPHHMQMGGGGRNGGGRPGPPPPQQPQRPLSANSFYSISGNGLSAGPGQGQSLGQVQAPLMDASDSGRGHAR